VFFTWQSASAAKVDCSAYSSCCAPGAELRFRINSRDLVQEFTSQGGILCKIPALEDGDVRGACTGFD